MWSEIEKAKAENRREIVLSGKKISIRIEKGGLDLTLFYLGGLNFLNISETVLSEIPDEIQNLIGLQTLVLHSNQLKNVNLKVFKLDKLKTLDLSRNIIESIPEQIKDLTSLVSLNLNGNKLQSLPSLTNNVKLTVLDVSNNNLTEFPDICSEDLINLFELKLSGNQIEGIPNNIYRLSALKLLDISTNSIKSIPSEIVECQKLKELNLKSNPISDRRLLKLIEQCRTKQILDYVKQHYAKINVENLQPKGKNKGKKQSEEDKLEEEEDTVFKYNINVLHADNDFKITVMNAVKTVREHIVTCIVNNITFNEDTFKKILQLQNKLHDTVCDKRVSATIATHDMNKLPPGNLIYTTALPNEITIKPLNRHNSMTGAELFNKLQTEANNLRREKKRNAYSGIHKYLYLLEGRTHYPCLLNSNKEVISFPPITNSDISKIDVNTTKLFIEVTSSTSQHICKKVMDVLLKDMVLLFDKDLDVQQVKVIDHDEHLKLVYPAKTDLNFDNNIPIKINRL